MSRQEHKPAAIQIEPGQIPEGHAITLMETQVVSAVEQGHSDERDLMNQVMGHVQMARAFSKFADVVSLSKIAHIKETKMYRALSGKKGVDDRGVEIADVGTWDGFCRAIGSSKTKIDEDLLNLRAFGEEALESLTRIGAGVREMRQYRRLPADDRLALIDAAKAGDKDELLDLAETLISRHVKEREALEARAKDAEDTAADRDRVIGSKQDQISSLEVKLASAERRQSAFTDEEKRDYECAPLHGTINEAMLALSRMEIEVARLTSEVGGELVRTECEHALALIAQRAIEISETYRMPLNRDSLLGDYSALDLRAAGLSPEALQ